MNFKELLGCSAIFLLSACNNGGEDPPKCIDNKPAPTEFSTTINELNHDITAEHALLMVDHLSSVRESLVAPSFSEANPIPISETFNLAAIDKILCQENTVALRTYLGMDPQTHQMRVIFVGVNPKGEDIIGSRGTVRDNPSIAETGQRYP